MSVQRSRIERQYSPGLALLVVEEEVPDGMSVERKLVTNGEVLFQCQQKAVRYFIRTSNRHQYSIEATGGRDAKFHYRIASNPIVTFEPWLQRCRIQVFHKEQTSWQQERQ